MSRRKPKQPPGSRHSYAQESKREAVQMLLDGHTASSVGERLRLSRTNLLYRWKREILKAEGGIASNLEGRVRELEAELRQVERERDASKEACLFSAGTDNRRVRGD